MHLIQWWVTKLPDGPIDFRFQSQESKIEDIADDFETRMKGYLRNVKRSVWLNI